MDKPIFISNTKTSRHGPFVRVKDSSGDKVDVPLIEHGDELHAFLIPGSTVLSVHSFEVSDGNCTLSVGTAKD